jgi:glycerol-3-phosphate acyltransferase PlsY
MDISALLPAPLAPSALALAIGYFLGSIPFGLIFTARAGLGDIRKLGSGNIGATNVLRTGNKLVAAATLLSDAAKGAVAVMIVDQLGAGLGILAALGAVLGHIFPAWLGFRGGKGVSSTIGVLLALHWPTGLIFLASWLLVALVTKLSSASALVAIAATPGILWAFDQPQIARFALILCLIIWAAHRENIHRLLLGAEPMIGAKK